MKKAIGYIRVSTDDQDQNGQSPEIQEKAIEAYCKTQKLELVQIVREGGISGTLSVNKRRAGKNIDAMMQEFGATHIVATKLDRLFRNTVDALTQSQAWLEKGIALHLLDFGGITLNTASPEGRLMFTLRAGFAEMEVGLIRSRTKAAMDHKRSKGECIGTVPFGFERQGDLVVELPCRKLMLKDIKDLHEAGNGSRFIAECISSDYQVKCSHTTITNLIKKGML